MGSLSRHFCKKCPTAKLHKWWRPSKSFRFSYSALLSPLLRPPSNGQSITMSLLLFASASTPSRAQGTITGEILRLSAQTLAQVSATSNATVLAQMRNPPPAGEGASQLLHVRFTTETSLPWQTLASMSEGSNVLDHRYDQLGIRYNR